MPGVQKPHCRPWWVWKAACTTESEPSGLAMPSMVRTSAPSTSRAKTLQDFTDAPSRWTTQAPHWAVSQPTWVPVRRSAFAEELDQRGAALDLAGNRTTVHGHRHFRHARPPCWATRSSRLRAIPGGPCCEPSVGREGACLPSGFVTAAADPLAGRGGSGLGARGMIGRLNHVAIAVPDLAAAAAQYRDTLGRAVGAPQEEPEHGVTVVFVELPNTKIELLHPLGEGSPIAGFLARNPAAGSIISASRSRTSSPPATGSRRRARACSATASRRPGAHGKPVLFLHPKDFAGTLLELEEA